MQGTMHPKPELPCPDSDCCLSHGRVTIRMQMRVSIFIPAWSVCYASENLLQISRFRRWEEYAGQRQDSACFFERDSKGLSIKHATTDNRLASQPPAGNDLQMLRCDRPYSRRAEPSGLCRMTWPWRIISVILAQLSALRQG